MATTQFKGVYTILATPFTENREIDIESLRSLVDFEIRAGVDGVVALGILGEVHRLTDDERNVVMRAVVSSVDQRVPVICGTGGPGTDVALSYTEKAQEIGAKGVIVAPPRLPKQNDGAVYDYFVEIAKHASVPIIIQDEPNTYGINLSIDMISRLSTIKGVDYIKLEDPPTTLKISKIKSAIGDRLGIFGGLGGLYAYEELCRGACGIMTGFAYPEILRQLYDYFEKGETEKARNLFYEYLPLIRYEAQPNVGLAIRKEILRRRGAIRLALTRPPSSSIDGIVSRELDEIIASIGQKTSMAQTLNSPSSSISK